VAAYGKTLREDEQLEQTGRKAGWVTPRNLWPLRAAKWVGQNAIAAQVATTTSQGVTVRSGNEYAIAW